MEPDNPPDININISDVMEVIEMDLPECRPCIKIIEQPASKALRFRYECEGRSAGSIPGVSSTPENKTYPTIQIVGYQGRAVVVVSCVTKESPYKPHPHNLVGRDGCKKGVCTVKLENDSMTASFDHLGIQCVKKKDIEEALKAREEIRVDPFRTGFGHRSQPGSIDLNAVRLCFQAFIEDKLNSGTFKVPLVPVVSDIIYDKKALCDLAICKLSHCSASVAGGLEMILLCEKVAKEDIAIQFYEEEPSTGQKVWWDSADFTPTQVHKQVAITFKTPRYRDIHVEKAVNVFIQLRRPSDGETSEPLPFLLTPLDSGESSRTHKRPKVCDSSLLQDNPLRTQMSPVMPKVKREPADTSPNPYYTSGHSPLYRTPSPMEYSYHQGIVYEHPSAPSTSVVYPTMSAVSPQMNTLTPPVQRVLSPQHTAFSPGPGALSPQQVQPSISNRGSPLPPMYSPSPVFVQPGNNEELQNGTFIDISSHKPPVCEPPVLDINSTELTNYFNNTIDGSITENFSSNLSLTCDTSQHEGNAPPLENMTDSLTKLAAYEYEKFEGN